MIDPVKMCPKCGGSPDECNCDWTDDRQRPGTLSSDYSFAGAVTAQKLESILQNPADPAPPPQEQGVTPSVYDKLTASIDWRGHEPWCPYIDSDGHEDCTCSSPPSDPAPQPDAGEVERAWPFSTRKRESDMSEDLEARLRKIIPYQGKSTVAFLCHEAADALTAAREKLAVLERTRNEWQIAEARVRELERTHKWNILEHGLDLLVCKQNHDKNEPCNYRRYTPVREKNEA
jgi:hypothetical protein